MRTGKVSQNVLERSVLRYCRQGQKHALQGAGTGNDCAVLPVSDRTAVSCALHAAVIDQTQKIRYCLEHAMNNLACSGCLPTALMSALLLPNEAEESVLKEIMAQAEAVCEEYGLQICGGHTEVTPAVACPVLTATAFGVMEEAPLRASNLRAGMDLLIAGTIAQEGTALLAAAKEKELRTRFPADFVENAIHMGRSICILDAAQAAKREGAAALHDVSQGGIFGALWELCEGAQIGLEADLRKIPIRQETVEICEYYGKNPYQLLSGGSLLIGARNGKAMEERLRGRGIDAVWIGTFTEGSRRILRNKEEIRFLERPAQDAIWEGEK